MAVTPLCSLGRGLAAWHHWPSPSMVLQLCTALKVPKGHQHLPPRRWEGTLGQAGWGHHPHLAWALCQPRGTAGPA